MLTGPNQVWCFPHGVVQQDRACRSKRDGARGPPGHPGACHARGQESAAEPRGCAKGYPPARQRPFRPFGAVDLEIEDVVEDDAACVEADSCQEEPGQCGRPAEAGDRVAREDVGERGGDVGGSQQLEIGPGRGAIRRAGAFNHPVILRYGGGSRKPRAGSGSWNAGSGKRHLRPRFVFRVLGPTKMFLNAVKQQKCEPSRPSRRGTARHRRAGAGKPPTWQGWRVCVPGRYSYLIV